MTPAVRQLLLGNSWTPYNLPRIAARYDVSDLASLVYDGSNRVGLFSDKSGNSAENCLVLNGVSGNSASIPDSVATSISGDIDLRAKATLANWIPGSIQTFIGKGTAGADLAYRLVINSTGFLIFQYTADGTTARTATASVATGLAAFTTRWVRATYASSSGNVNFYTSDDGSTWTAVGTQQTITSGSVYDSARGVTLGQQFDGTNALAALVHRAQIRNGIDGTVVFDADFTAQAKLAGSFTESSANAATVTINASGTTGARICGARDLYQATAGNKGVITLSATGNYVTFDGINDFSKSAPFSLSQPTTVYFVGSQVSWTANDYILDGNAAGSCAIYCPTSSPRIRMYAGTDGPLTDAFDVGTRAVLVAVFNGAGSTLAKNRAAPSTGNVGSDTANGFTIGANGGGTGAANITFSEAIVFTGVHDAATQLRVANYLMRKWQIAA